MTRLFDRIKSGQFNKTWFYSLLAIPLLVSYYVVFFVFKYCDLTSLTAWSYEFLDSLSSGTLGDFYSYLVDNPRQAIHLTWGGNWLCLIPIAIWNVPLWLLNGSSSNMALQPKAFLWTKLLFVICAIITAHLLYKTIKGINSNLSLAEKVEILFLFLASPEVILSVVYAGQDEIIYILFFLWGICQLFVRRNWITFIILSTISITFCPLMFLPFIAIVLIAEKRIGYIIINMGVVFAPSVLFEIINGGNEAYQEGKLYLSDWIADLMEVQTIPLANMQVSVLAVILIFILIHCYFGQTYDYKTGESIQTVVWTLALLMFIFSVMSGNHFYRFFLYVPFLVMLIYTQNENKNTLLFLWLLLQMGRTIQCIFMDDAQVLNPYWRMDNRISEKLIIALTRQGWYTRPNYNLSGAILAYMPEIEKLESIVGAVLIAAGSMILWITYPKNERTYRLKISASWSVAACGFLMPLVVVLYFTLIGWWV